MIYIYHTLIIRISKEVEFYENFIMNYDLIRLGAEIIIVCLAMGVLIFT